VNFAFSEEQEELRRTLRRFVGERWNVADVRRLAETPEGYDRVVWKRLACELGLVAVAVPETLGGQGLGFVEQGIVLEELGRELAGGPYLATTCLALPALLCGATGPEQRELVPPIATGAAVATLAVGEGAVPPAADRVACEARRQGAEWHLVGRKRLVLDGAGADLVLAIARDDEGVSLFALAGDDPGLAATPVAGLDPTRKLADLELRGARGRRLGTPGSAWPVAERALALAAIGSAAEQVGAAARCLETAVAHAGERIQFGRPIGSFQAVKHRAAEVLLELELARSAAYWSWWAADQHDEDLAHAASVAKAVCSEALLRAAAENIHIHGGMGVTWEHDAHLYYRRAKASELLLGDPAFHRARLARGLLDG
jgi:alkylation response protein AidB-like acyl-CoA dehydrogenase